jgi:hypothetical protein
MTELLSILHAESSRILVGCLLLHLICQ